MEQDPLEHGIRKALNLGHTVGHASSESLALAEGRPVLHGYAVVGGIVCELYLSYIKVGFPKEKMRQTIQFIKENYGGLPSGTNSTTNFYELMKHDKEHCRHHQLHSIEKKSETSASTRLPTKIPFTEMFDFYRECMGV